MSKYTTELRFICETEAGLTESVGYSSIDTVLDGCRDKIFDFDFPIFDENYREPLENKILKHFYTREIGAETVGLWKHWLCTRLNEIMPYYNQLYQSTLIEFDPFNDVDLTTDYQKVDNGNKDKTGTFTETGSTSGETSGSSTGSKTDTDGNKNDHWEYFSNTPEGGIDGVADLSYLTTALHTTDDKTGSTSSSAITTNNSGTTSESNNKEGSNTDTEVIRNVEDYLHHIVGKRGGNSYSKLILEYRKTFLNIDMQIINDLSDLFLNLW